MTNLFKNRVFVSIIFFISIAILFGLSSEVMAEWPEKPVTMVVPFSTGGTTDRLARMITPFVEEELGQPLLVENEPGGGGLIGKQNYYFNAPDDGSKLVYTLQPYMSGSIFRGAEYDIDDFAYMGITYRSPMGIWVREDSEFDTLEDLILALQDEDQVISISYIPTSWSEVATDLFIEEVGGNVDKVPYDGGGPQRMAVVSGDVTFSITEAHGTQSTVGEDLKPLGVFLDERIDLLPDTPTVNSQLEEMGYSEMPNMANFRFIFSHDSFKENYPDRWDTLVNAFEAAFNNPELNNMAEEAGLEVLWLGPEEAEEELYNSHEVLKKFREYWE